MNLLALLHPSARRSVASLPTQRLTVPLRSASDTSDTDGTRDLSTGARPARRHHRRPHSKNCKSVRKHRKLLLKAEQQQHLHRTDDNKSDRQEATLETDVERVQRQIAALDRRLSLLDSMALVSRQNAQSAALQMMETYHRFTRRGYEMARDEATSQFMRSMFVEDVRCPDFTGLRVFMQQWEQLSVYHASITVDTEGLDLLPTETMGSGQPGSGRYSDDVHVIKSFGTTTCRISRKTIERIFPHVLHDEPLVQWLIGKQYAFSYTMHMHVNSEGKIFQFESKVDLTSALLDLLHDPLVTLKMVEASTMTRSGNLQLQDDDNVREAQNTIENGFL